jgi:hypothetical protein
MICRQLPALTESNAIAVWSLQQQRLLRAMGYEPLRRVSIDSAPASDRPAIGVEGAGGGISGVVRVALGEHLPAAGSDGDRLLLAVLRAAGLRREDVRLLADEPSAAVELRLPPLRQLAANAAARRALWPALRALRRQRAGRPR